MNELIERLLADFEVDGVKVPISFLHHEGHEERYIVYQQVDADSSLSGDNELIGYAEYYDFDIYSKGNITRIAAALKAILKEHDFVWQPMRTSGDMYETDTKYYHKTLNFAILREE